MCLAQGPQRSDAGEAQIRGPSVSSRALYHWASALPTAEKEKSKKDGNQLLGKKESLRKISNCIFDPLD